MELHPNKIIEELIKFKCKLAELNAEILKLGNQKTVAEYNYRVAKAKAIVILRSEKIPVTLISDLVKGDEEIAKLKMQLDGLEVMYDNKREIIRSLKESMSVYQSILNYLKLEIGGNLGGKYDGTNGL